MNTLSCFRCQFGGKCNHLHGLYSVDIGFMYVVCNMCGHVVYHGRKKAVQEFIRQKRDVPVAAENARRP